MDWRFLSAGLVNHLLPVELTSNGAASLVTLRLRGEHGESQRAATGNSPEAEFRVAFADKLKDSVALARWRERRRELIAARKRHTHAGTKMQPLLDERSRLSGQAPRGWASKVAELDAQLAPMRDELSRLDRECRILEEAETAAEQSFDGELAVVIDQTARAICDRRRGEFDTALTAAAAQISPLLDSLLRSRDGVMQARALQDRRPALRELAETVLAEL
jgi:hypothetical protein